MLEGLAGTAGVSDPEKCFPNIFSGLVFKMGRYEEFHFGDKQTERGNNLHFSVCKCCSQWKLGLVALYNPVTAVSKSLHI